MKQNLLFILFLQQLIYRIYSPISRFKYKSKCNFLQKIASKINGSNISQIEKIYKRNHASSDKI